MIIVDGLFDALFDVTPTYATKEEIQLYVPLEVFTLAGSRSKLPAEQVFWSDWDFAAPLSEGNKQTLKNAGFEEVNIENYRDDLTTHVYAKVVNDQMIQVALKTDYDLFLQVWNSITPEFFEKYIWKNSNPQVHIRSILNQLFRTAKCARNLMTL